MMNIAEVPQVNAHIFTIEAPILVVDDRADARLFIRKVVEEMGYTCETASSGEQAIAKFDAVQLSDIQKNGVQQNGVQPFLVFMDVQMSGMSGLDAMQALKIRKPDVVVIIVTGNGTMDIAIRAMQDGAFDYISKPLSIEAVQRAVREASASYQQRRGVEKNSALLATEFSSTEAQKYTIIGQSAAMQQVFKRIGLVSITPNHSSVLIFGESGTGKEMIARTIHASSKHSDKPFVGINCTAIPETLLESELFGAEKGSYTGSTQQRIGKFELAGEGTIFLDEIGDLTLSLQAKLLRVLQERAIERVGGNTSIHIAARFIAATHRNLAEDVKTGRFREDLLYRLNVVVIELPPLRNRKDDVLPLARHFVAKYNTLMNRAITGLSKEAEQMLVSYDFSGNVRELENIIERAFIFTTGNTILPNALGLLHPDRSALNSQSNEEITPSIPIRRYEEAREAAIAAFEQRYLKFLLKAHAGNVTSAAQEAGLTRQYFHRMMQRYGIDAHEFRPPKS